MANTYEISNEQIPQILLVISDDYKIPVDIFSSVLDEQIVLSYDDALKNKLSFYMEMILSGNYTNVTANMFLGVARVRQSLRNLYKEVFSNLT